MPDDRKVPIQKLILVPAIITLAITLLRLVGELLNWAPSLFNKDAGGGGALVGIAWLVPIFGIYFAVQLVRAGFMPPSVWRMLGFAVGGIALLFLVGFATDALGLGQSLVVLFVFCAAAIAVAWGVSLAWPALGRTLVAYGLAARIPVVIVMLVAMLGRWGTHYDVSPPDNAAVMDAWHPLVKWIVIGLLPQLTIWMAFTVVMGTIFGGITAAILARRAQPVAGTA